MELLSWTLAVLSADRGPTPTEDRTALVTERNTNSAMAIKQPANRIRIEAS
jgi:hypothetical protein